jgi:hypothetical protein
MNYIRPVFKFAKREFRDAFLNQGQIKIGTLFEYRDSEKYSGKIYDKDEGKKSIQIYFDNLHLTGKELSEFGIAFFGGGEGLIHLYNSTVKIKMDENDCYIYCTSSEFFSDSLFQAVIDGYDACTLITNPDLFFNELKESFKYGKYIDSFYCLYIDRDLKLDWEKQKEDIEILKSIPASTIKPKSYAPQREIRTIFLPSESENNLLYKVEIIPSLKKYLLPINFDDLDINVVKNKPDGYRIGVRLIKKDGKPNSIFSIKFPNEVFTPVIFGESEELDIGFVPETLTNTFRDGYVINADCFVEMTEFGAVHCVNKLNEITSIEYFSEKDDEQLAITAPMPNSL